MQITVGLDVLEEMKRRPLLSWMMVSQKVTGMEDLNGKQARLKSEAVRSPRIEWCSVRGVSVTRKG